MTEKKTHCDCGARLVLYVEQFRGQCHKCSESENQLVRRPHRPNPRRSPFLKKSIEALMIAEDRQRNLLSLAAEPADQTTISEAIRNTQGVLKTLKDWQRGCRAG